LSTPATIWTAIPVVNPGHHHRRHEAHHRAELEHPEQGHHDADQQREHHHVGEIGRIESGLFENALAGQRDGAGQRLVISTVRANRPPTRVGAIPE
jgi:hypothetical protein